MSIVQLDRMTIYGPASQQDTVIDRLQDLGCVHLVDLGQSDREIEAQPDVAADARTALKYLESFPIQRRQVRREQFDRNAIVGEALEVQRKERELEDEHDTLEKAIRDLKPWGDFQFPSDVNLGPRFWFYVVRIRDVAELSETDLVWHEAARDHQFAYVVVLSESELENTPGTLVELDRRPLSELEVRLDVVEEELDELHLRREGLTRWCDLMRDDLNRADDKAARDYAQQVVLSQGRVFALQGWTPRDQRKQLERFASESGLAITVQPPAPDEEPPTLLHNPEQVAGGEGCVTFYKTPGYWTWDPSTVVFFSFAIFFAMILADAGYALLLGLLLAWKWKKMSATPDARKGRNLLLALVAFSFVYGALVCSYFGASPPGLDKLRVLNVQDQAVMMPLSIAIGILHISLANFITAWRLRGRAQAISALGWIGIMVGGMLAGMGGMATSDEVIKQWLTSAGVTVLVAGFIAVFLFSSERPLLSTSIKNHLLRVVDGFKGLTRFSSLFGDVLSYLRLFALGLSSAQLAGTFNELGAAAWDSAGFGVLMAILIIFVGHFLNLLLALMSGVVHGLRLNCIEFFNWSLPRRRSVVQNICKESEATMSDELVVLLGWTGIYAPLALGAVGSIIGVALSGQTACGAMLDVDGGYGRFVGVSAMPSSQIIYGIVIMFTLNQPITGQNAGGMFAIGVLVGLALLASAIYQGKCCAAAINASKSKPEIFGLSVAPAAIVEGFAVFAFVFALVLSNTLFA